MKFLKFSLLLAFMVILDYHGNAQCKRICLPESSSKVVAVNADTKHSDKVSIASVRVEEEPDCQMPKSCQPPICPPCCKVICLRDVRQFSDPAQTGGMTDLARITAKLPQKSLAELSNIDGGSR